MTLEHFIPTSVIVNICISSFQYICVIFSMKKSLIRQIRNVFLTNHKSICIMFSVEKSHLRDSGDSVA